MCLGRRPGLAAGDAFPILISPVFGGSSWGGEAMPTYAYRCLDCGKEFDVVETISEHASARPKCPECGAERVAAVPTRFYAKTAKKS